MLPCVRPKRDSSWCPRTRHAHAHINAVASGCVFGRAHGRRVDDGLGEIGDLLITLRRPVGRVAGRHQYGSAKVCRGLVVDDFFDPAW